MLGIAVHTACVTGLNSGQFHRHGLLVELHGLRLSRILYARHPGRQHIVHRLAPGILLDIHHRKVQFALGGSVGTAVEIKLIAAPLAAHQFQRGKTQVCHLLEPGHEHTRETHRRQVRDRTDLPFIVGQRNLELIPLHLGVAAVAQMHYAHLLVSDIILAHDQILRAYRHFILEITLILVERIVLIDILDIGSGARRLIQRIRRILGRQRVALHTVVTLVALEHTHAALVVVISAIEMIIVACRITQRRELILLPGGQSGWRHLHPQFLQIILI